MFPILGTRILKAFTHFPSYPIEGLFWIMWAGVGGEGGVEGGWEGRR